MVIECEDALVRAANSEAGSFNPLMFQGVKSLREKYKVDVSRIDAVAQRLFAVRFLQRKARVAGLNVYKSAQRRVAVLWGPTAEVPLRGSHPDAEAREGRTH
jgi:hypothetical protein